MIFPLFCIAMMVVMFLFMMRRGGMGCMRRSGHPASALDILNSRYAGGEIGRQEYEEKKAEIASSK